MSRSILFLSILCLTFGFAGCSSDDDSNPVAPIPDPVADFTMSGSTVTPATITFNNLSENASFFEWDFGNGRTSSQQNPVMTYDSYGFYIVELKATDLGSFKSNTISKTLSISPGRVFIEQISVRQIPYNDPNGYTWDLFTGLDPDIYWSIEDVLHNTLRESSTYRSNVSNQMLPISFNLSPAFELPVTTKRYYILLWDYDDGISDEFIQGGYFDLRSEFENEEYPGEIFWLNSSIPFEMTVTLRWQ